MGRDSINSNSGVKSRRMRNTSPGYRSGALETAGSSSAGGKIVAVALVLENQDLARHIQKNRQTAASYAACASSRSIRSLESLAYSSVTSMPVAEYPSSTAARTVAPDPAKGSRSAGVAVEGRGPFGAMAVEVPQFRPLGIETKPAPVPVGENAGRRKESRLPAALSGW